MFCRNIFEKKKHRTSKGNVLFVQGDKFEHGEQISTQQVILRQGMSNHSKTGLWIGRVVPKKFYFHHKGRGVLAPEWKVQAHNRIIYIHGFCQCHILLCTQWISDSFSLSCPQNSDSNGNGE